MLGVVVRALDSRAAARVFNPHQFQLAQFVGQEGDVACTDVFLFRPGNFGPADQEDAVKAHGREMVEKGLNGRRFCTTPGAGGGRLMSGAVFPGPPKLFWRMVRWPT